MVWVASGEVPGIILYLVLWYTLYSLQLDLAWYLGILFEIREYMYWYQYWTVPGTW